MSMFWERYAKDRPTSFVPTQFLSLDYLAHLWDLILFSPYAEEVKNALKILDDQFEDLAFIKTGSASYADRLNRYTRVKIPESDRTAVVKLKHLPKSIPLSSMGDGMLRVLQLALTIFPAKDGILLIDEFENGLHWSIQEKVWEMIFKLSADLNIQVFATTHSDDAVKAFSNVATKRREVGVLVKLVAKNSEQGPGKTIGVVYDEETLRTATLTETEVR
jgi:predicted ATPase